MRCTDQNTGKDELYSKMLVDSETAATRARIKNISVVIKIVFITIVLVFSFKILKLFWSISRKDSKFR